LDQIAEYRLREREGRGMSMKRKRPSKGPYVAVSKAIMATPAWRAMSPEGRLLWIELRGWLRNDGLNNGKVLRSCRDAAKSLGFNKDTIARRFAENEHYGFLRKTSEGFLGADGRGVAAKYRFTDLAHGTHPPTRDFEKWKGERFVCTARRAARKKQNPVLSRRTPRIMPSDIRKLPAEGSVCIVPSDIGEAPRCIVQSDISRLPLPTAAEAVIQGSLTARAPAQAGDAGSSPAPVANSLTAMVLGIVSVQLDELAGRRQLGRFQMSTEERA
jgi:hypothetical protein